MRKWEENAKSCEVSGLKIKILKVSSKASGFLIFKIDISYNRYLDIWNQFENRAPISKFKFKPQLFAFARPSALPPTTPVSAAAGLFGDPHFRTWDGREFDFHGRGQFLLASGSGSGFAFALIGLLSLPGGKKKATGLTAVAVEVRREQAWDLERSVLELKLNRTKSVGKSCGHGHFLKSNLKFRWMIGWNLFTYLLSRLFFAQFSPLLSRRFCEWSSSNGASWGLLAAFSRSSSAHRSRRCGHFRSSPLRSCLSVAFFSFPPHAAADNLQGTSDRWGFGPLLIPRTLDFS